MSAQPEWQFVGNVPENYERYLVPSIFGPWAKDLVEIAQLQPKERVLDIACGTGIVARTAALTLGSGGSVVGLDVSLPMLAAARSAAAAEGLSIDWQEGSAMKLPLADAACDVVLCQQGLQFFPDRPAALREMQLGLAVARTLGAKRMDWLRPKSGLYRAGRGVNASYWRGGGCAHDIGTVCSEPRRGVAHPRCQCEVQ